MTNNLINGTIVPFQMNNAILPHQTNNTALPLPMNDATLLSKEKKFTPSSKKNKPTPEHLLDNKTGTPLNPDDNILREAISLWGTTSTVSSGSNNTKISRLSTTSPENPIKPSVVLPGDVPQRKINVNEDKESKELKILGVFVIVAFALAFFSFIHSRFCKKNTDLETRNASRQRMNLMLGNFRLTTRAPSMQLENLPPAYETYCLPFSELSWNIPSAANTGSRSTSISSEDYQLPPRNETPPPPYSECIDSISTSEPSAQGLQKHGFVVSENEERNLNAEATALANNSAVPTNLDDLETTPAIKESHEQHRMAIFSIA